MTESLPEPKSRKESYLAKAASMEVSVPEAPESREEQYLAAIAEGGGGGTAYTAGEGITIADDTISVDTTTIQPKLTAGTNVTITDNTISAAGGPTVVQTIGTSQADVMSQDATTKLVFPFKSSNDDMVIAIGTQARAQSSTQATTIGYDTWAQYQKACAFGAHTKANADFSVALGAGATAAAQGQMDIGTGIYATSGYNSSNYRLLTGVYDPQTDHDAATKGYVDGLVGNVASALNAINNGTGA